MASNSKLYDFIGLDSSTIAGFIDEESLLPGAMEPKDFHGYLKAMDYIHDKDIKIQIKPLVDQDQLVNLKLKSHECPLYYTLNEAQNEITATQGANGSIVFKATIDNDGFYHFTLYDHIDRNPQPNLISNGNFESSQLIKKDQTEHLIVPGWEINRHINVKNTFSEYYQEVSTQQDHMYQVTFYYFPNKSNLTKLHPIDIFWDDIKLITLDKDQKESYGYTFSVLGNEKDASKLKIVCQDEEQIKQVISHISVVSREQNTVPIVLALMLIDTNDIMMESNIQINVTTTPPLEIDNQLPIEVVFEQSIYQTIVINDQYTGNDPLTKINLDSIFQSLDISEDERLVQIIQRECNGEPTNVYEVQITDKNQAFSPITVADVQLSFPGGDAGIPVFLKNIQIDEI